MKAEQRKELETNILADKMGRAVQRVKTSPRRTVTIYIVIAVAVVIGLAVAYRSYRQSVETTSELWVKLDDGAAPYITNLAGTQGDTPVGKAARFQIAWLKYWELGIKRLGVDHVGALKEGIDGASKDYQSLAIDCKDDPVFEPQALLGIAVCEEAKALQDRTRLDKAANLYDALAKHEKYKDTAEGKFAQGRLDQLRDAKGKIRAEASTTYEELQRTLNIRELQAPRDMDPFNQLPPPGFQFGEPEKKDK
jgi:hypothetical protein